MELVVGRVVKSHGIRGELVVDVRTDSPADRFAEGSRLVGRTGKGPRVIDREVTIEAARDHSGRLLVRVAGVRDRDSADALRGMLLLVDSDSLPDNDDPDEFHDHQLEGLRVLDTGGVQLGEVTEVVHTPGGELLSIRLSGGNDALVPFVTEIVPEVDLGSGTCVIDPPEGLLDLGST